MGPDQARLASGVSPASQSDSEAELSESCTRMADTFRNSWRDGQDRLSPEGEAGDGAEDPEQVLGADSASEPRSEGARSRARGLPSGWVGGAANPAAAAAAERGGFRDDGDTFSTEGAPQHWEDQPPPHGPHASGSEPENPGQRQKRLSRRKGGLL